MPTILSDQPIPPLYNMRDIKIPSYIFYGGQDELSTPKVNYWLIKINFINDLP